MTRATAGHDGAPSDPHSSFFRKAADHWTLHRHHRAAEPMTMYYVTDRLHNGRTVQVPADQIAPTVSVWLAELGVHSPLVEDLARAARVGDWPAVCAACEQLSVAVTIAAEA